MLLLMEKFIAYNDFFGIFLAHSKKSSNFAVNMTSHASHQNSAPGEVFEFIYGYEVRKEAHRHIWKSHTNLTHPGKYFRPSKVKIMRPTSPK